MKRITAAITAAAAVAAAACLVLIALASGGGYVFFTPTAYISIDINPSLELGINRFDRIVSVEGYNAEAEELLDELDIRFLPYQEGIQELLESCGVDAEGIQSGTEEEDAGDDTEEDGGSRYRHHGEKEEESGHRHE